MGAARRYILRDSPIQVKKELAQATCNLFKEKENLAARARFVKMALPEKVREDPWINRARASSHHKSIQRRESMVVSMLTPPRIAASEQPLARWQVTSFRSARFRPSNSAVRPAQYWWLIP